MQLKSTIFSLAFGVTISWSVSCCVAQTENKKKVSEFGKYEGYSEARFNQWVLSSQYVEMRDGTKLAVDVVRPSLDGTSATNEKLPVVWTHSRYHRNFQAQAPRLKSMVDAMPDLQRLVRHGYAVASVGVRGSGASFGRNEGLFSPNETKDAYEIIEWLSSQSWCDGNVGMFGGSYLGMTQYMAASQGHPSLKAIFPNVAGFDLYDLIYPGGIFRKDMMSHWDQLTERLDTQLKAAPVQTDAKGIMRDAAIAEHADNWQVLEEYQMASFRNTVTPNHSWKTHNPSPFLNDINKAEVAAYHWNGFQDVFAIDTALWFANYTGPQKLAFGSWPHNRVYDGRFFAERSRLQSVEQHRWFDYWLKGIDNRIMDEAPVHYSVLDRSHQWDWKSAKQWPPASVDYRTFYFASGTSGSIDSTNDGQLQLQPPKGNSADEYTVDFSTTTGSQSRWDNAVGQGVMRYGDMTRNDRKCLTYTSAPLQYDVTVTGHPIATLFINSSVADCNFHVLLKEVDADGVSYYVTEGVLRGSQRKTSAAPWNNLGLPYQRCNKEDQEPLPIGEVTELKLDLHPVSVVFNKGNRIRAAIMCADKDNTVPVMDSEGAMIKLLCGPTCLSNIALPIESDSK